MFTQKCAENSLSNKPLATECRGAHMRESGRHQKKADSFLVRSENPIVRATVDIGHVAGRLFVCIGICIGSWFIGIRKLP